MTADLKLNAISCACLLMAIPPVSAAQRSSSNTEAIGSWTFSSEADPMSDRHSARIEVKAGGKLFSFQCDAPGAGSIYPLFGSDQYLGGSGGGYGRREIMLRFDSDQPRSPTWIYKGPIAFIPHDHKQSVELMKRAAMAQKLSIRAITYDGEFVDASFELTDTRAALTRLTNACQDGSDLADS